MTDLFKVTVNRFGLCHIENLFVIICGDVTTMKKVRVTQNEMNGA